VIVAWCEIVLNEMDLGLDDGEFIAEVSESVVGALVPLDFGGCVPVIEVSNGVMESVVCRSGAIEESVEPNRDWLGDVGWWVVGWEEKVNGVRIFVVFFPCQQEGSTIISEPDKLGVGEIPLTDRDLCGDLTFVWFITVGTAGEEEIAVDLVCVLLEPLL
jgi:hypothetical protein